MEIQPITVENLNVGYGNKVVLQEVNFTLQPQKTTVIMGGSGSGKSTLLKCLIGLLPPMSGEVKYATDSLYTLAEEARQEHLRQIGVLYQGGALWSDRTVAENVAFPLEEFTKLPARQITELVRYKLALVGMDGAQDLLPEQLSGGMRKRVSLARAMALDAKVIFLDEPSAGLDPLNARRLDELVVQLSEGLKTTFVVITHDVESIHEIAQHCLFLEGGRVAAEGTVEQLQKSGPDTAKEFLAGYAKAKA